MKSVVTVIALLWCVCGTLMASAQTPTVSRISLFGKEYVRADQWTRANGFQWKWSSRNEATVWNDKHRLIFIIDSKRMLLNGTVVLLSESPRNLNGVLHLPWIDVTTVIHPVVFPPRNRAQDPVKHICIDPGHGGKETGYVVGREQEKKYTLLLAQELATQLKEAGFTVSFTRTTDELVELPERPQIARRRGADLLVSLHFNSAGRTSSEIGGAEVYCMTPQRANSTNDRERGEHNAAFSGNANNARNMLLAYELQKSIVRNARMEDRGVKRARFAILRDASMPAVLIEGGFMSNPDEARKIYSVAWRRQMAAAIVTGIQSYKRIVE
jgi:N-acetylmuramoyl-L-alanine amidase